MPFSRLYCELFRAITIFSHPLEVGRLCHGQFHGGGPGDHWQRSPQRRTPAASLSARAKLMGRILCDSKLIGTATLAWLFWSLYLFACPSIGLGIELLNRM